MRTRWNKPSITIKNRNKEIYDITGNHNIQIESTRTNNTNYVADEPFSVVGSYLKKNKFFLDFVEQNINRFDLNDYNLNFRLLDDSSVILVKTNGTEISIQGMDVYFVTPNCYKVISYDIPVTKYTLEQLKFLALPILKTKEPKISLKSKLSKGV